MDLVDYSVIDKPAILELWWDSWHSVSGFCHPKPIQEWEARFDKLLTTNCILVAKENGVVVGFVMYDVQNAILSQLFVIPSHHRRGIGSKLFRVASDAMNGNFSLKVLENASNSLMFYESFGMLRTGKEINKFNGETEIIYSCDQSHKRF